MKNEKIAVVTGASRGLGRATGEALAVKGYTVVMAMRNPDKSADYIAGLKKSGLNVVSAELDVTDEYGIRGFSEYIIEEFKRCDVLINNAGIFIDSENRTGSVLNTGIDIVRRSMETNVYGAVQLIQQLLPLMKKTGYGRIVNVSSGMGALSVMDNGYIGYRMSKAALNVATILFAAETAGDNILINSICPGWVKTDMGGARAERTVDEGIRGIIWAATLPEGGPNGGFFRDGERLLW